MAVFVSLWAFGKRERTKKNKNKRRRRMETEKGQSGKMKENEEA